MTQTYNICLLPGDGCLLYTSFVKQECGGGFYKPPSSRRPYFNLLTNQSAIEISRSREGEGRTMSTRRFFAMLVRFSA